MSQHLLESESLSTLGHASLVVGASYSTLQAWVKSLGVSPFDTITLNAAEHGGIEDVRVFANQLILSPQFGEVKLGIVDAAYQLTPPAQNALLKILEEPPQTVKIILFSQMEAALLQTVRSRCRVYQLAGEPLGIISVARERGALEAFVQAEELAKSEDVREVVKLWLKQAYDEWVASGRPAKGIAPLQNLWECYQGLETQTNKRLLLEHLALSE